MNLNELSNKLTRKWGADVSQEAVTLALEQGIPLTWENCSKLAQSYRKTQSTWKIRHIALASPEHLFWDPMDQRWVLGPLDDSEN